jgi:hypothetical protein
MGIFIAAGCLCAGSALIILGLQALKAGMVNPVKSLRAE